MACHRFDRDAVAAVLCVTCKQPIGWEPYVEDLILHRFGTVLFRHRRCTENKKPPAG